MKNCKICGKEMNQITVRPFIVHVCPEHEYPELEELDDNDEFDD